MSQYFGKAPSSQIANEINAKFQEHTSHLKNSGYGEMIQELYNAYYNFDEGGFGLKLSGDKSKARIKVNHLKSLIQRLQGMVTNAALTYVPRARNSDSKSQIQADFAKGLLDFYSDEKNMNEYTAEMVERALVQLESYMYCPWSKDQGVEITKDDNGRPIMTGDQVFYCLSVFDVARHNKFKVSPYYIVRIPVNKHDEAALHPTDAMGQPASDRILAQSNTINERDRILTPFDQDREQDDDIVWKYIFLHSKTPAMPKGRHTEIIGDVVIYDSILDYKTIPVVRLTCSDLLDTVGGDSPATSLLSLQQPMDMLWSAVTTNNLAFAKQNIWSPTGIEIEPLSNGMSNVISAVKPEALDLVKSSPETYKLIEQYQLQQETLSGVNKTARGNPDSAVATAAGQALQLAQAVEFVNDLQRQYGRACSEIATIVIHNLQEFATEKRIAYIGGISRKAYSKEFTNKDVNEVDRVSVSIGNPMSQTISGRWTIATDWVQAGIVKNPDKLIEFLRTGQIDSLTEDKFKDSMRIREENEQMRKGEKPVVAYFDNHPEHFLEHKELASDPEFYNNPELMAILLAHEQEHIATMKSLDPDVAALLGIPPLPSQQQPPMPPPGAPQGQMPDQAPPDATVAGVNPPNLPEGTPEPTEAAYQQYLSSIPPIDGN